MIVASGHSGAAGPLGLLIILLIGVATVLLIRNMNGRLKRLPREFPDQRSESQVPDDNDPDSRAG